MGTAIISDDDTKTEIQIEKFRKLLMTSNDTLIRLVVETIIVDASNRMIYFMLKWIISIHIDHFNIYIVY